jgi:hypothetical protein
MSDITARAVLLRVFAAGYSALASVQSAISIAASQSSVQTCSGAASQAEATSATDIFYGSISSRGGKVARGARSRRCR